MRAQDLMGEIGTADPALIYLFCPAKAPRARFSTFEPLLAERAVARLVETYVDPTMKDLVYVVFYADETNPAEIAIEARTLPFLAERRVIVVRHAERYASEAATGPLLDYLTSPCDTAMVILIAAQVDKRTKFYKACQKSGVIVECPALNEHEVAAWIRTEAKARGKTIAPAAVPALAARAGTHLSDVDNALTLLYSYVGEEDHIREEDVVAACADVAEEEIWALTDAIADSKAGKALVALRKLLDLGKQPDDLMGIINWLLKNAYAVATAGDGGPAINSYVAQKMAPLARKLGVRKLRDAFALCTDTHFQIRSTGVDSVLALELLVVKLAAPRRRAGQSAAAAS